jgi:PAS domain S-box-containing protein
MWDLVQHIIILHINGKVIMANSAITLRLGYSREEVIGKNLSDVFRETLFFRKEDSFYKLYTDSDESFGIEVEFNAKDKNGIIKFLAVRTSKIKYEGENAFLSIFVDITERKHQEKNILSKIVETEESERQRFAADIHDDLGPILSSIKLHLGIIESSRDHKKIQNNISVCYTLLNEMIGKVHSISDNLMPHLIENYGLEAAIKAICENFESNSLDIKLNSNLGDIRFPRDFELNIYRIISELIHNSVKHSGSDMISIKLLYSPKEFTVSYSDNGMGYSIDDILKKSKGMGLYNILNRVNLINAKIEFLRKNGKVLVKIKKSLE